MLGLKNTQLIKINKRENMQCNALTAGVINPSYFSEQTRAVPLDKLVQDKNAAYEALVSGMKSQDNHLTFTELSLKICFPENVIISAKEFGSALFDFCFENKHLSKEFKFKNCRFTDEAWEEFISSSIFQCFDTKFHFIHCALNENQLNKLYEFFKESNNNHILSISKQQFTAQEFEIICSMLTCSCITSIKLNSDGIDDKQLALMQKLVIESKNINYISLKNNKMTNEGAIAISSATLQNKQIVQLILDRNRLTDDYLISLIMETQRLNLSNHVDISANHTDMSRNTQEQLKAFCENSEPPSKRIRIYCDPQQTDSRETTPSLFDPKAPLAAYELKRSATLREWAQTPFKEHSTSSRLECPLPFKSIILEFIQAKNFSGAVNYIKNIQTNNQTESVSIRDKAYLFLLSNFFNVKTIKKSVSLYSAIFKRFKVNHNLYYTCAIATYTNKYSEFFKDLIDKYTDINDKNNREEENRLKQVLIHVISSNLDEFQPLIKTMSVADYCIHLSNDKNLGTIIEMAALQKLFAICEMDLHFALYDLSSDSNTTKGITFQREITDTNSSEDLVIHLLKNSNGEYDLLEVIDNSHIT